MSKFLEPFTHPWIALTLPPFLLRATKSADMDVRRSLYQQVVLAGGCAALPGLRPRLVAELQHAHDVHVGQAGHGLPACLFLVILHHKSHFSRPKSACCRSLFTHPANTHIDCMLLYSGLVGAWALGSMHLWALEQDSIAGYVCASSGEAAAALGRKLRKAGRSLLHSAVLPYSQSCCRCVPEGFLGVLLPCAIGYGAWLIFCLPLPRCG
jgi:hypothetical protein